MKNKALSSIAVALAAAIASTGCKHTPPVTPIPPPHQAGNNPDIPAGPPINPSDGPGRYAESSTYDPRKWIQDRSALAADTIHFAFDSAVIRDSDKSNLQQVGTALNGDASLSVLIEGNCDERGTEEYNRSLGERRAEAAREALAAIGIDANRVYTISYGKDKPVESGHTDTAWSQNRRDDFVLLHPKPGT
ncbi:MAG: OmpA family protein [Limisphaerales bacterium]